MHIHHWCPIQHCAELDNVDKETYFLPDSSPKYTLQSLKGMPRSPSWYLLSLLSFSSRSWWDISILDGVPVVPSDVDCLLKTGSSCWSICSNTPLSGAQVSLWGLAQTPLRQHCAVSLALNYYQHMGPVHHDVVVYSDSMSCLQAIEGEDTENPFICHIMNLLWSLSDKGTRVRFCWVPSHCGIDGNERVDQLAKETLDQDIDPLASVHYTDMKPLVNSYIQKLVQTKWDVAVHGRDLYLVKPTLGPPKKFQHLTRAEEVVITRLRIGHTKATKSHILSRGPPTGCHHCGQTLTIDHMLLECALLQECRDEYYTVDSLNALFETIPETCIVEFLREAGFFYLI